MKLLRNPEVKHLAALCLLMTGLFTIIGLCVTLAAGLLLLLLGLFFTLFFLLDAARRYRHLACLAAELDEILHGASSIQLSRYNEGELSLLQNQLTKMILRLQEQSQQLADEKNKLSDSIADISHQIRTPLTAVHLLLSSMGSGKLTPEAQLESLREMNKLLAKIDWLVSSLLKIARLDAGTVSFRSDVIAFSDLISRVSASLAVLMELKGQILHTELSGSFTGDLHWTEEAVSNIFKNCIEHMETGGILSVSALENPLYSELIIADNGCGIDPDDLPHLFERFYKGKNASDQSIGIGLALSRMIIIRQNGTVTAQNRPEGGALFTIRFYKQVI